MKTTSTSRPTNGTRWICNQQSILGTKKKQTPEGFDRLRLDVNLGRFFSER